MHVAIFFVLLRLADERLELGHCSRLLLGHSGMFSVQPAHVNERQVNPSAPQTPAR